MTCHWKNIEKLGSFQIKGEKPKRRGNSTDGGSERQKRADRRSQSNTERPRDYTGSYARLALGKPTYFLYESACGYALILSDGLDKIDDNYESLEKYIGRFDQVFKLVAYHTFDTPEHAINQCEAISRGIVTEELMTFLIDNLPKVCYVDGLPCCVIAVGDPYLMDPIFKKTRMGCICGILHDNIIRGIRFHISEIIEEWKPEVIRKAEQELARLYNRKRRM